MEMSVKIFDGGSHYIQYTMLPVDVGLMQSPSANSRGKLQINTQLLVYTNTQTHKGAHLHTDIYWQITFLILIYL